MKKIISIILVILCMGIIFFFSSKNSSISKSQSDGVSRTLVVSVFKLTGKKANEKEINKTVEKINLPVRKLAHFSIYFVLGLCVLNMFISFNVNKKIFFSIILCLFYAISDEIHQFFVSGRVFSVIDILIDSGGYLLGIYLYYFIFKRIKKGKELKTSNI